MKIPLYISLASLLYWLWVVLHPVETATDTDILIAMFMGFALACYPAMKLIDYFTTPKTIRNE